MGHRRMDAEKLPELKAKLLNVCRLHKVRLDKVKHIFIQNRSYALKDETHIEYKIKNEIANALTINYTDISFAGSAQIGFSIHKETVFDKLTSDLDVACINSTLYTKAWEDVVSATNAFNDYTNFSGGEIEAEKLKNGILRRGMILVDYMPKSSMSTNLRSLQSRLSLTHKMHFAKIKLAFYMSEYAFCWKQDSVISSLLKE
jgi:hypothetical protein